VVFSIICWRRFWGRAKRRPGMKATRWWAGGSPAAQDRGHKRQTTETFLDKKKYELPRDDRPSEFQNCLRAWLSRQPRRMGAIAKRWTQTGAGAFGVRQSKKA